VPSVSSSVLKNSLIGLEVLDLDLDLDL